VKLPRTRIRSPDPFRLIRQTLPLHLPKLTYTFQVNVTRQTTRKVHLRGPAQLPESQNIMFTRFDLVFIRSPVRHRSNGLLTSFSLPLILTYGTLAGRGYMFVIGDAYDI
jgi:hypothetical protein